MRQWCVSHTHADSGAAPSSLEAIAKAAAAAREREEAELRAQLTAGKGSMLVNDTMEFVRNIQVGAGV